MYKKIDIRKYILIMIASVIIVFGMYLSNNIYNASFDQYIYSLFKSVGASSSAVAEFAVTMFHAFVLFVIFVLIFMLPTLGFNKKLIIKNKKKNSERQIFPIKNIKKYNRIVLAISIVYFGIVVGFFEYVGNSLLETDLFKEYYVSPDDVEIEFPKEKRNLIYIFLESTEMTNVSRENGGVFDTSIMPNLENLALNNINFSNSDLLGGAQESYGTGWTVAAMIAQTAGIPLKLMINDYDSNSTKFGNIMTLGDILSDNGYNSYLLLGSDANFGGRRAYFSNHNYDISDYYTAIYEGKIDEDYYVWWGYEDSKLFTYAKEKLEKISMDDKPFNLTLLTANTHFTDGYLEDGCENVFDNNYANSFYCSDHMISEFISWIMEQDFYENTTIVISGDHPTMQNNFYDISDDYVRSTYNVIINASNKNVNNKNRIFTSMDMFPTTLGAMGAKIEGDRLGLGTDLFSNRKTIPEEIGLDYFNRELKKHSAYYYKYIRG